MALDVADHAAVIDFCKTNAVELVVVGPETPLAAGIVDDLTAAGIKAFGPSGVAAQLESSRGSPRRSAPNSAFRPAPTSASPTPMMRVPMSRARMRRSWGQSRRPCCRQNVVVAKTVRRPRTPSP